ncbi:hypothetical protein ACHAXS_001543 [Conticribra weissflogii]
MVIHDEGNASHYSHDVEDNEEEGALGRLYDSTVNRPCQALGYCKTLNYCGTGAIDNMSLCSPNIHFLSVFRSYHGSQNTSKDVDSSSPYIYSSSAPIGPASCEYCGKKNTAECESNLPLDCYNNHRKPTKSSSTVNDNEHEDSYSMKTSQSATPCPRPKLFFLKKKPPFATPEGWNPKTEYRNTLYEPPASSMEARMAAWGEVRGAVGRVSNRRSCKGKHQNHNQIGFGESEASFSSVGGGVGGNSRVASEENGADQHKSPINWVSGLLG